MKGFESTRARYLFGYILISRRNVLASFFEFYSQFPPTHIDTFDTIQRRHDSITIILLDQPLGNFPVL